MTTKNRTLGSSLTTSNQTIYTVPAQFNSEVKSILISNGSTSYVSVTLEWYSNRTSAFTNITETLVLLPNSIMQITDSLYLEHTDYIRGLASVAGVVDVSVKVSENYTTSTL
jgi:hypothetical protein